MFQVVVLADDVVKKGAASLATTTNYRKTLFKLLLKNSVTSLGYFLNGLGDEFSFKRIPNI